LEIWTVIHTRITLTSYLFKECWGVRRTLYFLICKR